MQIDRSDLADEPGHAHVALRTRSAPDDPQAAGKEVGKAVGSDGLPDSSASHDPALRIERAATYRAAVDALYRQYSIDHGDPRVKTLGPETVIPGTRGPGYLTAGTAADDVRTGARGPASGREFDPEAAGGPIRQLDAGKERITNEGVAEVAAHLRRFTQGGPPGYSGAGDA